MRRELMAVVVAMVFGGLVAAVVEARALALAEAADAPLPRILPIDHRPAPGWLHQRRVVVDPPG